MHFARLPDRLRHALERESEDLKPGELLRSARFLSESYRSNRKVRLDSVAERLAYALTRMPATYGAICFALSKVPFQPNSLLDLGSGPGTTLWAFSSVWPVPFRASCLELNREWPHLAARLETPEAVWRTADLRALPPLDPHDLVVCAYALNEINGLEQAKLVGGAWAATARALLLIEPGTPEGFANIRTARRWLLANGAFTGAPCPHDRECPLSAPDWCHFSVRIERTRLHRQAKGGELGYEDEKFSYFLALREPPGLRLPRILRHPQVAPGRIQLALCGPEGLAAEAVTKRDKPAWREARKASWGDVWESGKGDIGNE
jgi:ribosomal protein RSM22 (predicted rRNA methylase)